MAGAGGGMGMRTIWIALRAVNYSEQAFKNTIKQVKDLSKEEKELRDGYLKDIDTAKLQIQTATLYLAMISMVGTQLTRLLNTTQVGAQYMGEFNQSMTDLKTAFADTLFVALKPLLDVLMDFMKVLKDNSALRTVIVYGGLLALVIGALYSAYMIYNAILSINATRMLLNTLMTGEATTVNATHQLGVLGLTYTYRGLAMAIGQALAGFTIAYMILSQFDGPARIAVAAIMLIVGALVALWAIESAASMGIALVAGGVAAAGAVGLATSFTNPSSYAVGTRMVEQTGPAILHRGELVYNPSVNRPAGIEKEVMGNGGNGRSAPSNVTVNFSGDINTRASVEDIDTVVSRRLYRAIKGAS